MQPRQVPNLSVWPSCRACTLSVVPFFFEPARKPFPSSRARNLKSTESGSISQANCAGVMYGCYGGKDSADLARFLATHLPSCSLEAL